MVTVIKDSRPVAKKDYNCDACFWLNNSGVTGLGLTISELRSYIKARNNRFKIQKGEKYVYQFNINGSDSYSFRAIPEIHSICLKYDIYEE